MEDTRFPLVNGRGKRVSLSFTVHVVTVTKHARVKTYVFNEALLIAAERLLD